MITNYPTLYEGLKIFRDAMLPFIVPPTGRQPCPLRGRSHCGLAEFLVDVMALRGEGEEVADLERELNK